MYSTHTYAAAIASLGCRVQLNKLYVALIQDRHPHPLFITMEQALGAPHLYMTQPVGAVTSVSQRANKRACDGDIIDICLDTSRPETDSQP